jgi:putative tryptophan/tyrosine transport system substrate-binding protein
VEEAKEDTKKKGFLLILHRIGPNSIFRESQYPQGAPMVNRNSKTGSALLVVLLLFSACSTPPKHYRIGILCGLDFFKTTADGFKSRMTELGYTEGVNISYDMRSTNFDPPGERAILEDFAKDSVDLIVAFPTEVALLAKEVSSKSGIPLIFANANVEGVPLVDSILKPGGIVTGVRYPGPDIAVRRLEILHEMAPNARQILVPYEESYPIVQSQLDAIRPSAESIGLTIIPMAAHGEKELDIKLQSFLRQHKKADAILMIPEPLAVTSAGFWLLSRFADAQKIPLGGARAAENGLAALCGVSTDNVAVGRQAGLLADEVLKGTKAGTLPVVSAETFLHINLTAARQMKIDVPVGLLKQANEVIK